MIRVTPSILKKLVRGDQKAQVLKNRLEKGYEVTDEGLAVHRQVYLSHYGPIQKGWVIHHVDGDRTNNHPSNLMSLPPKFHNRIHADMRREGRVFSRREVVEKLDSLQSLRFRLHAEIKALQAELQECFPDSKKKKKTQAEISLRQRINEKNREYVELAYVHVTDLHVKHVRSFWNKQNRLKKESSQLAVEPQLEHDP